MSESEVGTSPGVEFVSHYLQDLSFEAPFGPCPPEKLGSVDLKRDVRVGVEFRADGLHHVSVQLYTTGTLENRTILLCELTYKALVRLHQIPDPVAPQVLGVDVPQALLPAVKRVLEDNSVFAGFPRLRLEDIDFLAVYQAAEASGQVGRPPAPTQPKA